MTEKDGHILLYRIWILILCCLPSILGAQMDAQGFQVAVLNQQLELGNTRVLLELGPSFGLVGASGFLETDFDVEISFVVPGSGEVVYEKSFRENRRFDFFSGEDPFFRAYSFELPVGSYEMTVGLRNRKNRRNHFARLNYVCKSFSEAGLSDILILRETAGALDPKPQVGPSVTGVTDRIQFQADVYSPTEELLTLRAVLYRESVPDPGSDDADRYQVNQFTSVIQLNEVIAVGGGKAQFTSGFDLTDLETGRYLFELFLYRDDALIAEKNTRFELPWKELKEVFFDLDRSIRMMAHIASPEQITSLLEIASLDDKLEAFRTFWEQRAEPGREVGTDVLERYYGRIFEANAQFGEGKQEGWETDRGKVFTLYGVPDRKERRDVHELWFYSARRLIFVFEEQEANWRCIYPVSSANN